MTPAAIRNHCATALIAGPQSTLAIAAHLGCSAVSVLGALRNWPGFAQIAGPDGWEWTIAGSEAHTRAQKALAGATVRGKDWTGERGGRRALR